MSQAPTDSPYRWRAADLEGIRIALDVTPFIGPGAMRGVVMQQLLEPPPGAYAPGGPNGA